MESNGSIYSSPSPYNTAEGLGIDNMKKMQPLFSYNSQNGRVQLVNWYKWVFIIDSYYFVGK